MDLSKISYEIPTIVREWAEHNAPTKTRAFVSVILYRYGQVVERTFAVRNFTQKGIKITEVRRRATGNHPTIVKNIYFTTMGEYTPVFEPKTVGYGYNFSASNFGVWYQVYPNFYQFESVLLNAEILTDIAEFKYCGYQCGDVIRYLNKYRTNPIIEFFGKLGLPLSNQLISKAEKDKKFRKFLYANAPAVGLYGVAATIGAYKSGESIEETRRRQYKRRVLLRKIPMAKNIGVDIERLVDYCTKNSIGYRVYNDYLEALIGLKLDLKDTKNLFPREFMRMHDLRIEEYEALQIKKDRIKRKGFYEAFAKAGEKAAAFEMSENGLCIIAPHDPVELKLEGSALHHCVGRMGYDKRMADGQIFIMFVRKESDISTPYVTIEYDIKGHRIKQAYGSNNTQPPEEVAVFLTKWLDVIKEIQKQKKAG